MASLLALSASGAETGSGGLPQLNVETFPSQIFWLLATLIILYLLMSRIALPRIASVLEERADAIADDLDAAEEFNRKAKEAEAAYDKALADARSKAQAIAAETRDEIQKQVNEAMAKADAEISARAAEGEARIAEIRDGAKIAVREVALETSNAVVEAIMPDAADADALKAAVTNRLEG
ncbi:MAG: F0F1 ATP synthase subunit B' [Pseudomonadota bacterium]